LAKKSVIIHYKPARTDWSGGAASVLARMQSPARMTWSDGGLANGLAGREDRKEDQEKKKEWYEKGLIGVRQKIHQ
jgi:hypothetical protein